jgi:hypothetical protein
MRAPEWLRRLRAFADGYFWLPCDICGEMFAGFERPTGSYRELGMEAGSSHMTCPNCPGYWLERPDGSIEQVSSEEFYEQLFWNLPGFRRVEL